MHSRPRLSPSSNWGQDFSVTGSSVLAFSSFGGLFIFPRRSGTILWFFSVINRCPNESFSLQDLFQWFQWLSNKLIPARGIRFSRSFTLYKSNHLFAHWLASFSFKIFHSHHFIRSRFSLSPDYVTIDPPDWTHVKRLHSSCPCFSPSSQVN